MMYCKMIWVIQTMCVVSASPDGDSDVVAVTSKAYLLLLLCI